VHIKDIQPFYDRQGYDKNILYSVLENRIRTEEKQNDVENKEEKKWLDQ
jgi:hypothetical protein